MIDTHCHLTDERLKNQLGDVPHRAASAGVDRMVTVATTWADSQSCIELCRELPNVRCAVGLHPNNVDEAEIERLADLRRLQADPTVVALGEMGLDYHYPNARRDLQIRAFERQMQLAAELGRPAIIHCREAADDSLALMKAFPTVHAVFHCFTGTLQEAKRVLDAGYLLGFTGVVTFKKSDELRQIIGFTPLDRMLVETDAPYLSPEPMRKQKINEPALVVHTVAAIAKIKEVDIDQIDRATTLNAERFFRWQSHHSLPQLYSSIL